MVRRISIIICLYLINLNHAYSSSCFLTYFENEKLQNQLPCEEYINKNKEFFKDTPQYLALKKNKEILNPNTIKRFLELRPDDYFVMATKEYEENKSTFRKNVYKNGNPHNIPKSCLRYCRDSLLVTDNQLHSCYKIVKKEGNQGEPKYCQDSLYRSIQKKSDIGATLLASDSLTSGPIEPSLSIECPDVNAAELKNEPNKKDETKPSSNSIDKSAKMLIANLFGGCEALNYKVTDSPNNSFFIRNKGRGYVENEQSYFENHYAMKHLHNKSDITCKPEKVTPFVYGLGGRVDPEAFDNGQIIPTGSQSDVRHNWNGNYCVENYSVLPACRGGRAEKYKSIESKCKGTNLNDFLPLSNSLKCTKPGDVEVRSLDCTGFVMAAVANAGLRIIPGGTKPDQSFAPGRGDILGSDENWSKHEDKFNSYFWNPGTSDFLNASSNENPTCLEYPSKDEPIKPGDIFQWKSENGNGADGHIGIISDVEDPKDPFGFISDETINDVSDCEEKITDSSNFNFTIAHSADDFGGLGPMIIDWKYSPQKTNKGMIRWAINACKLHYSKNLEREELTHEKTRYIVKKNDKNITKTFQILRHKGTEDCKLPDDKKRPKVPNEDCMRNKCQEYF